MVLLTEDLSASLAVIITECGNPDDNGALRITTADAFSTPENNPNMVISLTTNKDANKDVDVNFSITGGADQDNDDGFFSRLGK
jgi:hypothetical protein